MWDVRWHDIRFGRDLCILLCYEDKYSMKNNQCIGKNTSLLSQDVLKRLEHIPFDLLLKQGSMWPTIFLEQFDFKF